MYCLVMGFSSGYPSGQRVRWPRQLSEGTSSSAPCKDCCPQSRIRKSYCRSSARPYQRLSLRDCGVRLLISHWPLQRQHRGFLASRCLIKTCVCRESPCQLGGKSCGACVDEVSDTWTLLSILWPLLTQRLGLPMLTLSCVTCTMCYILSWVWGQRYPKSLLWWPQETMKVQIRLARMQTNTTFLEGNLSLCTKSLKTAVFFDSMVWLICSVEITRAA